VAGGPAGGAAGEPAEAARLPEFVFVTVENRHSSDVVVTLVHNGQSSRLGLVPGSSSTTLQFPGRYIASAASLQLSARAIGGNGSYTTGQFVVQPGQGVTLSLESQLPRSSFSVF
jgi:hypothetical protein